MSIADEALNLCVVLKVIDGMAQVENAGSEWPVEAFLDRYHPFHMDALADLGGDDLAVVPWWPSQDMMFSIGEAFLSAEGHRLVLRIETTVALGEYLSSVLGVRR